MQALLTLLKKSVMKYVVMDLIWVLMHAMMAILMEVMDAVLFAQSRDNGYVKEEVMKQQMFVKA